MMNKTLNRPQIKIYIACHKKCEALESDILVPVHVGAALAERPLPGMQRDDTGDNISAKNPRFCELTAQYWAWKNADADYYGFCHYRRYFSFSDREFPADPYNNIFYDRVSGAHKADFCLNDADIAKNILPYDMVLPRPMDLSFLPAWQNTVYKHYRTSQFHHIEDYDFCCDYIRAHYPDYVQDLEAYNSSSKSFFLNMYILRKELFFAYCAWLFPILDAFDAQRDYAGDSVSELRAPGFLAERLFGIWVTHALRTQPSLKVRYAQTSFIRNTDDLELLPAFAENNVAVCLGADDRYTPFAGLVISSIVQNASATKNYDIIVFSNGISLANQDRLLRTLPARQNVSLRFIDSLAFMAGDLFERDHINRSTYLRFIIPKALKHYPKAVYLDCDIVVNRDIAELYDTELGEHYLAAVRDTVDPCWYKADHDGTQVNIRDRLGMDHPFDYFNCGVLVINIPVFNALFPTEALFALARSRRWVWQDQDVMNYLCKGHTLLLSQKWNVLAHDHPSLTAGEEFSAPHWLYEQYLAARKDPYIVHYCGRQQPCYKPFVDLGEIFWSYARNSAMYEILLGYAAAEQAAGGARQGGKLSRAAFLFKKGMKSLKTAGIRATWNKVHRLLSRKMQPHTPAISTLSAAERSLLRKTTRKLLAFLRALCQKSGARYWLTADGLFAQQRQKTFLPNMLFLSVGMLREDLEKLRAAIPANAPVVLTAQSDEDTVLYALCPRSCPAIRLTIYTYDRSDLPASKEGAARRDALRIRFVNECRRSALSAQEFAEEFCRALPQGKTLALGPENKLFGYAPCLREEDVLPVRNGVFAGEEVSLPQAPDRVLAALYLQWDNIYPVSPAIRLDVPDKKHLRAFCAASVR